MATKNYRQRSLPAYMLSTVERLAAPLPPSAARAGPRPLEALGTATGRQPASEALPGGYRRVDPQARLSAAPLCAELDWTCGTVVRARPTAAGYRLERCEHSGGRGSLTGTVDAKSRIRLPKPVHDELDPTGAGHIYVRRHGDHLELYPPALIDELLDTHLTNPNPDHPTNQEDLT